SRLVSSKTILIHCRCKIPLQNLYVHSDIARYCRGIIGSCFSTHPPRSDMTFECFTHPCSILLPLPQRLERSTQVVLCPRPVERRTLPAVLLQGGPVGLDRFFQPRGPGFPLPQRLERSTQVVLCPRPVERHTLPAVLLQGGPVGLDRFFQPRG